MKRNFGWFLAVFFCFSLIGCGGGDSNSGSGQTEYTQFVSTGIPYEFRVRVNSVIFPNYNGETHYMHGNPLTWGDANGIVLSEMPESDPVLESPPFIATGSHLIRFSGGIIPETERLAYSEGGGDFFSIGANFLKSSVVPLSAGGFAQPPLIVVDPYQRIAMVDLAYFGRPCQLRGLVFYVAGDLVGGWTNDHLLLAKPTEDWKVTVSFTESTVTKSWNIFWDVPGDFYIPEAGDERAFLKSYLDLNALIAAGLGQYITCTSSTSNAFFQISNSAGTTSPSGPVVNPASDSNSTEDTILDPPDGEIEDGIEDPNSGGISGDADIEGDPDGEIDEIIEEDDLDADSGGNIIPAGDPNSGATPADPNSSISPDSNIEEEIEEGAVNGNNHFMWRIAEDGRFILLFKESDCGDYPDDGSPFYLLGEVVGTWECLEGNRLIPSSEFSGYWESPPLSISGWKNFNFAWQDDLYAKHYAWYTNFSGEGNPFVNSSSKSFRGNFTEGTVLPPQ